MRSRILSPLAISCLLLIGLGGCAGGEPSLEKELDITCSGKCDGVDTIRSLYRDIRDLDLADLSARGTSLASEELNDALSVGPVEVEFETPVAFGPSSLAADEEFVEDLGAITAGLLARFGEDELSTEVNQTRVRYLESSDDDVFIESGFSLGAFAEHGFNVDADGFEDSRVRVGLGGASLTGRVVAAAERDAGASPAAILEALRNTRGFVIARDIDDLVAMKPGESFALGGEGTFGLNLGAGVPIVVSQSGALSYNLVVSGALRAQIEGQLDVQVVRLNGNALVVDVGTERGSVRSARLALSDGWGVQGLVESVVNVGGQSVDLGRLLDRALRDRLNDRLNLLGAEVERTRRRNRMSVTRLRFDLSAEGIEEALSQAIRGDMRLAQALAQQGVEGVQVEYDLSRSGISSVSHAGLELFGMRFFRSTARSAGEVSIETPGGAQELLFESLRRESGWLFESHGYGRTALSGLRFDARGRDVRSEVNLFVQVAEGDDFMQRDTMLDHIDSLISTVGGEDVLFSLEDSGNALQRLVERTCRRESDRCRQDVLDDTAVIELRAAAAEAINQATQGADARSLRDLLRLAAELRIASQATVEPAAALVGPPTGIVLDYRIDDAGVDAIFGDENGEAFRQALLQVMDATRIDREDSPSEIAERRSELAGDERRALDDLVAIFDDYADRYQRLSSLENAEIDGLGVIGGQALAIDLAGDSAARSIVQARAETVRDAFDALLEAARDLDGIRKEHALGYALLAMLPQRAMDIRFTVDMDLSNNLAQSYNHYRAAGQQSIAGSGRGSAAQLIGGGVFDIESLINIE